MGTNFTIALISVNILIITLLSFSIIIGFLQVTAEWEEVVKTDITAALNIALSEKHADIDDISELSRFELTELTENSLDEFKGKLHSIRYYSGNGDLLSSYNLSISSDIPVKSPLRFSSLKPELIKWTARVRYSILQNKNSKSGVLTGKMHNELGRVEILSYPLMGYKYSVYFDQIITKAFFIGIIFSLIISFTISLLISGNISKHSKIFAGQLAELAGGKRNVNFIRGTTKEMESSTKAAESLQKELKYSEEAQLRKLKDIIHDLKTPVSALSIQFEALCDGVLQINNKRINLLSSEFERIEEIISELSKYTKLASEDYIPEPEAFDMNSLIEEVLARFQLQAKQKNILFEFVRQDNSLFIETDRIGIMRVMNNLAVNALNNAPENTHIKISAELVKSIINESEVIAVEIENTGMIEEKDLPLIFDRLYRSKNTGYHGSGLGLAISKTIVEKNSGKITARNTAFNTVVFRMELPAKTRLKDYL